MSAETTAAERDDGVTDVNGHPFMYDAQFRLVPLHLVKPVDKLIDELVRELMAEATGLAAEMAALKVKWFERIASIEALIAQEYGAKLGGPKGNMALTTYDARQRVQVQVQDQITFGPELQAAKALVDECIAEWSADANGNIRALVEHAFQVDKEGRINRTALFALRRLAIEDPRWKRAMDAITDSIRTIGSKTYLRFHRRDHARGQWEMIPLDMAAA